MPELEETSKHWDGNIKIHTKPEMLNWLDSPVVLDALPKLDDKYNPSQWILWSQERLGLRELEHGLSIGSGDGILERHAIRFGIAKKFDGIDISPKSIEHASNEARKEQLDIDYYLMDINAAKFPHSYDIIYASASLHHVSNLTHLLMEVRRTLKPGGYFVFNEFVGPNRFQWNIRQLAVINIILSLLPKRLRRDMGGKIKTHVLRPTLEEMAGDPSEAVRSEDILPRVYELFDVIYRLDYGGTILNMLLHNIVHNFNSDEIKPIARLEKYLIKTKVIASDFCVVIARHKKRPID